MSASLAASGPDSASTTAGSGARSAAGRACASSGRCASARSSHASEPASSSARAAATSAGFPVGPLQISDELNMELMAKIRKATEDAAEREGVDLGAYPAGEVISTMIGLGRPSRLKGAGFYDYDEAGKRLAKRDDARAIGRYRDEGATPADIRRMVGL